MKTMKKILAVVLMMAAVVGFEPTQHTGSKPAALPTRLHRYNYKTQFFLLNYQLFDIPKER